MKCRILDIVNVPFAGFKAVVLSLGGLMGMKTAEEV